MLVNTRGIVLKNVKYRETSVISTIFTEEFGTRSYILRGIRSSKSKKSLGVFHPLSLQNLTLYNKQNAEINYISEFKPAVNLFSISGNVKKSTILMFLTEMLYKSIREHSEDIDLFEYLFNSIQVLEEINDNYQNFHLQFLLKLTKYLGFGLDHGLFEHFDSEREIISQLLNERFDLDISIPSEKRRIILRDIIKFYQSQIDSFGQVRSLEVLKEVFA